ncbi:acyltransferase family protein [Myxococcota bacterium]|nr:acyltransferase family protein [Myxococcota bacterium]MBU1429996.1 acyltransferase family protein [Myxococcota bacterium]MBU1898843.1 acyltransferase family protein [Myxococcota bacterium]
MRARLISGAVEARLAQLPLPFNRYGLDPFGVSRDHLALFYTLLEPFYRRYFRVKTYGRQHVPSVGRGMLIGNHSGGIPVDAAMLLSSIFFEGDHPRHAHGMVEKFAQTIPFISTYFSRLGQLAGLPEHALQMLRADRLLMVFPEGARGTGKLYKDRYKLMAFGTGFMRIALQTHTPIIPFAFIGGEEALPTIYHAKLLSKLAGTPYWPVPPYLIPWPLPVECSLHFGEPMRFEGNGSERDEVIEGYVEAVQARINALIIEGRQLRGEDVGGGA